MAEFGIRATNLQGPSFAGSRPVAPVQRAGNAPIIPAALIRTGLGLVGSVQEATANDQLASQNSVYSMYQKQLAGVAQAKDFGDIGDSEANARVRAISAKFLAEGGGGDPKFAETLKKIRDGVFGTTSLEQAEEGEKTMNELKKSQLQEARSRGLLDPFSDPSAQMQQDASDLVASIMKTEDEFKRHQDYVAAKRGDQTHQMAVNRYEMETQDWTRENAVRLAGADAINKGIQFANTSLAKVSEDVKSGKKDFLTARAEIATMFAQYKGVMGAQMQDDPRTASLFQTVLGDLEKSWVDANNPENRNTQATALFNENMARFKLIAIDQSPALKNAAVLSSLAPNVPLTTSIVTRGIADALGKLSLPNVNLGLLGQNNPDVENGFYNTVGASIRNAKTGNASNPEQVFSESSQALDKTFQDMANNTNTAMADPKAFKDVTKFIASPEVAELIGQNRLNPVYRNQARDAWKSSYEEAVKRGVTRLLNQPVGLATGSASGPSQPAPNLSSLIDFRFSANGLEIISKQGASPVASPQFLRQQERNVKQFTEAFNLLIKAGAHLEGTTDYVGYWERNKSVLMPDFFPSPEQEAQMKAKGYMGGNYRNPANWRKVDGGTDE